MGKNRAFGATALVAGCCIGAGMLALPLATLPSGFFLSVLPLFIGWSYMYFSGQMVLEVYLNVKKNIHLMGLLDEVLGKWAKILGAGLFFFLFYCLLTAYLNASSLLIGQTLNRLFDVDLHPKFYVILNFFVLFLIITLSVKKIDLINRGLVFFMILFYLLLIYVGIFRFNMKNLGLFSHFNVIVWTLPVFILSFGFQNLIPTVAHYLKGDSKRIKSALFRGTLAALIIYLIWNLIVLGVNSTEVEGLGKGTTEDLVKLFNASGPMFGFFIKGFSLFAILTSILTVALSFLNFISDSSGESKNRALYTLCVLLPPTIFSFIDPAIFLKMLKIAGGIGSVLLFGVLPPFMIWKKRAESKKGYQKIVPFGKKGIFFYLLVSLFVITLEVVELFP